MALFQVFIPCDRLCWGLFIVLFAVSVFIVKLRMTYTLAVNNELCWPYKLNRIDKNLIRVIRKEALRKLELL